MPIVSSQIVSATVQASGDRSVHERHTDHSGRTYDVNYFAPASMDIAAVLSARAANIRAAIDEFNAGYATNPLLTAEQKAALRVTLEDYRAAQNILPTDSGTIRGVQMYEALGLIAVGRAAEVLQP